MSTTSTVFEISPALIFIVLAAASTSMPASAQGFNCRYAKTPDEVRICQSEHLRGQDERMSEEYSRLHNEVGGAERRRLEQSQREWLSDRKACGSDPDCLADVYRSRRSQLERY
jgi:uncharacterized protein